jgi:glycine cleavage system H protein
MRYTKDHEWVRLDGDRARVGVTDYAQQQLGDVVFVDLPEVGRRLAQGDVFGSIESVKAVSDLFSPLSGEVVEVNGELASKPELVNAAPHETWMVIVKVADAGESASLLDSVQYEALVSAS